MQQDSVIVRRNEASSSILATNRVLRNTYALLALSLLFSAGMSAFVMASAAPIINPWLTLLGYFGLLFATSALRNSGWGILCVFALTGFMGYTLGPILNIYLHQVINGPQLVMTALGMTGAIFITLSAYVLITKKDFSFMTGFITAGLLVAFFGAIAALLFHLPMVMIAASAAFVLLASGVILIQTSSIVHGGETNYIMATVTLYVSLYNLFISLLQILSFLNGRD